MKLSLNIFFVIIYAALNMHIQLFAQKDSVFQNKSEWEVFPILNYDSDAGFGYGGKGFLYNFLNAKESFDLTLYNSTKGEHWYRFVFSDIDIQRRQGKKYPVAIDLIADYDKWINYKYYFQDFFYSKKDNGVRSASYNREVLELAVVLSKGLAKDFVAELGFRFKSCNGFGLDTVFKDSFYVPRPEYASHVQVASLIFNFRWDTRKNYINPENGFVLEIDNEIARDILNPSEQNFYKAGILFQDYIKLLIPKLVFANRFMAQVNLAYVSYLLSLPLGGNNTIRGLPQDRYLCKSFVLINSELRFPVWWRLGGIAGVDIGNSDSTPNWIVIPVAGLRFYMNNFVVRFDVGFGNQSTRFYFNFGHIF